MDDVQKMDALKECYIDANRLAEESDVFRRKAHNLHTEMENALLNGDENEALKFWEQVRLLTLRHITYFHRLIFFEY